MQPITSTDFRSKNEILHHTTILANSSWTVSAGCGGSYKVPMGDVLDLNNNGRVDIVNEKVGGFFGHWRTTATEPELVNNLGQLKEYALRNKAEVITQDDVNLQIETNTIEQGQVTKSNQHAIDGLVSQLEPFEKTAKWAIDLTTNEFLIYKPKA